MKVAVFSSQPYDVQSLESINQAYGHELVFFEAKLSAKTASLASDCAAVCAFINDLVNAATLRALAAEGISLIALRSAGFNNVDLDVARELGIAVVRVPAYSPYAVAEHAVGLILTLNRKLHRAYNRTRDDNFSLQGLLGFDLHGKTVGIVGTGRIGTCFASIMRGFGCRLLAHDLYPNQECRDLGVEYVDLPDLLSASDVVSLHCPQTPETHHLINGATIQHFKAGAMLINTSRDGLIDTTAIIQAIKSGKIGYLGMDVYEQEADLFFRDLSDTVIQDDAFQLLQSFSNVVITAHQAFFTREALSNIATTTLSNITDIEAGRQCPNRVG